MYICASYLQKFYEFKSVMTNIRTILQSTNNFNVEFEILIL